MSSDTTQPAPPMPPPDQPRDDLGPLPRIARPFVDWVARVRATVHTKLLAGFLVIALLLLSMGILCIAVLGRVVPGLAMSSGASSSSHSCGPPP